MKQFITVIAAATLLASCGQGDTSKPGKNDAVVAKVESPAKQLFVNNCMQCHALKQDRTGPALAGVKARWNNDEAHLLEFVKNSQKVIAADGANSYAGKLFDKWYKTAMPAFSLRDEDIKQILDYADKGEE